MGFFIQFDSKTLMIAIKVMEKSYILVMVQVKTKIIVLIDVTFSKGIS